jgi:RNA polymerase sigma factor (sigma-70 family)
MPSERRENLIQHVRRVASALAVADAPDEQLLRRFLAERDQAAFTALVNRHGRMVLGVCRRVLQDGHDAEDAFQATFLVLARKARSVSKPAMLFNWLYSVAQRTALEAKTRRARRRVVEREAVRDAADGPPDDLLWAEIRQVLDEEIGKLPTKYRLPFVLCHLEGKTNEEAAKALRCPTGTVQSRLSRAKERLRLRLTRRGIGLTAGTMATILSERIASAKAPSALVASTIHLVFAAAPASLSPAVVSAEIAILAQKVVSVMWWNKFKMIAVSCLLMAGLCTATGTWAIRAGEGLASKSGFSEGAKQPPAPAKKDDGAKVEPVEGEKVPTDKERIQGTWIVDSVTRDGQTLRSVDVRALLFGGANPGGQGGFNPPGKKKGLAGGQSGSQETADYGFTLVVSDDEFIFLPNDPETMVFAVPVGDAELVAKNLQAIYKRSPTISINAISNNSVSVNAPPQDLADIWKLLANLSPIPSAKTGLTRLQVASYQIDPSKRPTWLDLIWTVGADSSIKAQPRTSKGIYRLEDEKLTIVLAEKGDDKRPI